MIKSLIKEYKNNRIFDFLLIKKELDSNLKFFDKDKKIFKIEKMYIFKRNPLNLSALTENINEKYNKNIYHSADLKDGLDWLYIKEILEFKEKNKLGNKKTEFEHILQTNKLSIEITKDNRKLFLTGHNFFIKKEILTYIDKLKFSLVEIPKDYKLFELFKFFKTINFVMLYLTLDYKEINLRLKRIRKYKKEGMFIYKNLIIIDPRNPFVFFHELGHFIYENKIEFKLKNKNYLYNDMLIIAKENENKFKLNSYKKLENYNLNSEIFANWFEQEIMDVISNNN